MNTREKAAKLLRELEDMHIAYPDPSSGISGTDIEAKRNDLLALLDAEPVAWRIECPSLPDPSSWRWIVWAPDIENQVDQFRKRGAETNREYVITPLYLAPQPSREREALEEIINILGPFDGFTPAGPSPEAAAIKAVDRIATEAVKRARFAPQPREREALERDHRAMERLRQPGYAWVVEWDANTHAPDTIVRMSENDSFGAYFTDPADAILGESEVGDAR